MTVQTQPAISHSPVVKSAGMHRQHPLRTKTHVAVTLPAARLQGGMRRGKRPRIQRGCTAQSLGRSASQQNAQHGNREDGHDLGQATTHPAQSWSRLAGRYLTAARSIRQRTFSAGLAAVGLSPGANPAVAIPTRQTLTGRPPIEFHTRAALSTSVGSQVTRRTHAVASADPALVRAVVVAVAMPDVLELVSHEYWKVRGSRCRPAPPRRERGRR